MLSASQDRAPGVLGGYRCYFCIWPGHRREEQKHEGIDWSSAPIGGISIGVTARDLYCVDNRLAREWDLYGAPVENRLFMIREWPIIRLRTTANRALLIGSERASVERTHNSVRAQKEESIDPG